MAAENFKVKKGLEVGTGITANSDGVNVTGIITATQFKGDGSGLTGVVGSGSGVVVKDEGSAVGTAGTINFVGSGVAATLSAGTATVTVNAGGLDNVVEDTTPELGGNLNLNSKFVTGSGGINVTGVVTATTLKGAIEATTASFSGAIDANGDLDVDGQTEVDDLNVAGVSTFTTAIVNTGIEPDTDNGAYLGTNAKSWSSLFVDNIGIDGNVIQALSGNLDLNSGSGSVVLKHGGNQKLTTTINGIEVPDLNVTGVGTVGRLDTSGVTLGTNSTTFAAKFADNAVANFGTDNDLKISHNDSDANIVNSKGSLRLQNNTFIVLEEIDGTNMLRCDGGGAVNLYFNGGSPKLVTDQAGVKITGVCTATSFSGSGTGLTSIPSAQLTGALPALDGSALTGVTGSGSGIIVRHDGNVVGTASSINFSTNLDVSAISAGIVTVTASGSSGVSLSGSTNNTVATVTGANALIGEANLTFDGNTLAIADGGGGNNKLQIDGTSPFIQFREGTTNKAYVQWSSGGNYLQLGNEEAGEVLRIGDGESGLIWRVGTNNRTVWTSGNDGASSGLDADLLDGQEGSYYTNATNLASGTIPNGRFPATLPATSGVNLTALNASEITSGTLPIARIADDAVTFAKMQNVGTGVFIGRNDGGTGDIETLTAAEARTLLNVADGATAGITTAPSNIVATWNVVNQSASAYRFTGPGQDGSSNNPDIYLVRGNKYRFALNASGHPFQIRVSNGGSAYNDGVTNNGAQTGNVEFYVQNDAPASLVYQCTSHGGMVGNIYITGHQLTNGADNRVVTATSAYGMTGESGLTYNGSFLGVTGDIAVSTTNRVYFGNSDVAWVKGVHGSSGYLELGVNTAHVRLTRDGNVGIGTDNPASQFNLKLASRTTGFRITDSNSTADCLRAGAQPDGDGMLQLRTTSGSGPVLFDASGVSYITGGDLVVGGTAVGNTGSFGVQSSGAFRSILAASNASDTLLGAISGVSNGFQINIDSSNNQIYTFHNGSQVALRITSGGDILIADTTNSVYNDTSGGGINLKANGQIVTKKQATSAADPLVWLNDTGQTTNKFIVFAQDGTEKANIGLAGNNLSLTVNGSERIRTTAAGFTKIGFINNVNPTEPLNVVASAVNQDIARFTGANRDRGLLISTAANGGVNDCDVIYDAVSTASNGKHTFKTDGTTRLHIDENGYLIKAAGRAAAFNVKGSNMARNNAGGYICTFDDDSSTGCFDSGGNFNTSTYKFIAPVAGLYYFFTNLRLDSYSTGYIRTAFLSTTHGTSSSFYNIPETGHVITYPTNSSGIMQISTSTIMNLAKDDEVYVWQDPQNDTSYTVYLSESSFGGYLIG